MSDAPSARPSMDVDIACVGFGPAAAGFLTVLSRELANPDGAAEARQSRVAPGLPLQVVCYERADGIAFGVSGVVTRAHGIRATLPDLTPEQIPMAASVAEEKLVYLLDPIGASQRSRTLRIADSILRGFRLARESAFELPYIPPFLEKRGGMVLSLGQFLEHVGGDLMASGAVQVWPGMPVSEALVEDGRVTGVRLADMDVRAALTVVADGPVGAVGRQLDREFGVPVGHAHCEWALGMKMVVELAPGTALKPGTVIHTFGYPEPEIFGFLYALPENLAAVGIFVPSWFHNPARTAYRYLQHFMLHPYLWRYLQGGKLRSWGAKSIEESGRRAEPFLAGNGYARVGEGSGSTNPLAGSGVDEAWITGAQLAEAVLELLLEGRPLTRQNLEATYVARRRGSWVEEGARIAEHARDGFHRGLIPGLLGMALVGMKWGRPPGLPRHRRRPPQTPEIERIMADCHARGIPYHDALMDRCGWPPIPYDGQLLVSHQDALLMGGKVQATPGFADHVRFRDPELCRSCAAKTCIEMCSGQALSPGEDGIPAFDREKCVFCGACLWNCNGNIEFGAGAGGLHSNEN